MTRGKNTIVVNSSSMGRNDDGQRLLGGKMKGLWQTCRAVLRVSNREQREIMRGLIEEGRVL